MFKAWSYLTSALASPSKFNILSVAMQMFTQNEFRPILCVCVGMTIDAMLNFGDIDVDANADVRF